MPPAAKLLALICVSLRFGVLNVIGFGEWVTPLSRTFQKNFARKWHNLVHFWCAVWVTAGSQARDLSKFAWHSNAGGTSVPLHPWICLCRGGVCISGWWWWWQYQWEERWLIMAVTSLESNTKWTSKKNCRCDAPTHPRRRCSAFTDSRTNEKSSWDFRWLDDSDDYGKWQTVVYDFTFVFNSNHSSICLRYGDIDDENFQGQGRFCHFRWSYGHADWWVWHSAWGFLLVF